MEFAFSWEDMPMNAYANRYIVCQGVVNNTEACKRMGRVYYMEGEMADFCPRSWHRALKNLGIA